MMLISLISTLHNSTYAYTKYKINMNHGRTLKYSENGCVFALLVAVSFAYASFFFLIAVVTTTETVNFNSNHIFISIISSIFLKLS